MDGSVDGEPPQLSHPLDRAVWSALTTRQASIALRNGQAVRLRPDIGVFAATADEAHSSPATLECGPEGLWLLEAEAVAPPSGLMLHHNASCVQMVAECADAPDPPFAITMLRDADAPEMFALARRCEPGPFFENTHCMGRFIGVKQDGKLVAMAGERFQPRGFTEVSGVCTLPEYRGRGYAGGLMRTVAARISARGETPFLHSYADNAGAIALYEALGFRIRMAMTLTVLVRKELNARATSPA
jgi:ribosomal protein S18 acetylase RimI-like enzyme